MTKPKIAGVVVLSLLLASGCGTSQRKTEPSAIPESSGKPLAVVSRPMAIEDQMRGKDGVTEVVISDEGVTPPRLVARVGQPVRLHVVNRGGRPHNFVIEQFGVVGRVLGPGEENYIEFTPGVSGEFPVLSDEPEIAAWKATLVVER